MNFSFSEPKRYRVGYHAEKILKYHPAIVQPLLFKVCILAFTASSPMDQNLVLPHHKAYYPS